MLAYLKRLVKAGAAYQLGGNRGQGHRGRDLAALHAPRRPGEYGAANILLTSVILASIVLRLGLGEAFVRFWFDDRTPSGGADRALGDGRRGVADDARRAAAFAFAGPLSELLLGYHDPVLLDCATLGLWAFTNLEMAYALLRVEERTRAYMIASGINVALTVTFTVILVVFAGQQRAGTAARQLRGLGDRRPGPLVGAQGQLVAAPTTRGPGRDAALRPADGPRGRERIRAAGRRPFLPRSELLAKTVGVYAASLQMATVVFLAVRGFQYAWPPLAYSIEDDAEAAKLYSLVTTYYALATGVVVCAVALLGRWLVRLLVAAPYFDAYKPLPWLALGWALYGLYLVFVVISGRARVTSRNLAAAAAGLAVNVGLLLLLVPASGAGLETSAQASHCAAPTW